MTRIIERYDGDAQKIAQLLVEEANGAGGRDNISVIFVAGPEFLGAHSAASVEGRSRHATTRMRKGKANAGSVFRNLFMLATGAALALAGWLVYNRYEARLAPPVVTAPPPHIPKDILADSHSPAGVAKALEEAAAGDTILVPAGEYVGPLVLKDRVNVIAQGPGKVIVRADPAATGPDAGIAIIARGVKEAHIKDLHIEGNETHPLHIGLLIADSSIEVEDLEVSGASDRGVRISGDAHPLIMAGNFHNNSGPGISVQGQSAPRIMDNRIAENGRVAGALHSGIEISNEAQPTLLHNEIAHNGLSAVFPMALDEEIRAKNTVDPRPAGKPAPKQQPHTRSI